MANEIPQEELQKVLYATKKEKRENETFSEALVNSLKALKAGKELPYAQETIVSVPNSFLEEDKNGAKDFIKKSGEIGRKESFNLPVTLETESFETVDGNQETILNIVAKYSSKTDVEAIEEYFNS